MRFAKPSWVVHKEESGPIKGDQADKRLSIFSVHVHPDGSRIATGGLDAKVRIWSTKPILNEESELSNRPPKSLCTLSMHTGPVLTVRWAHSGKWLASGSDDAIVLIYDLDPTQRGKIQWGSNDLNIEGWKPLKRLPGHESDVTDVAWAPGDRYLASTGLDSTVIIWCGYTLERLRRLDQHQGFVKGVCWDPVGEFLATQSDDKTVKIWRTTDWGLEAEISKPFEDSPGSTFFRRLSWSPDGAHITASNATNNKGFVFIAAVITRNSWTSEISLVGHENTVEVAAYNPHIFLRNPAAPVATSNICSVVALGADDRSVSVWQTKCARPLIVAKEVFDRQIMDLNWSWDGLTLYAVSSDGTLAAFAFEPEELEGLASHSVQEQYLKKFSFEPPPLPEGYSHVAPSRLTKSDSPFMNGGKSHVNGGRAASPHFVPNDQGAQGTFASNNTQGDEQVHMLVAKRKDKRRVQLSGPGRSGDPVPALAVGIPKRPSVPQSKAEQPSSSHFFPSPSEQPFQNPNKADRWPMMDVDTYDVQISTMGGDAAGELHDQHEDASKLTNMRARTLGGDRRPRDHVPAVREIPLGTDYGYVGVGSSGVQGHAFAVPPLLTLVSTIVDGSEAIFEASNSEDHGPTEIVFSINRQTQWLDFLPSPVLLLKATSEFCATATSDGCINVYSHTGRRLLPTLNLGSPCAALAGNAFSLVAITCMRQLYSWDLKSQRARFPPTSVDHILVGEDTVRTLDVRQNGAPVIVTKGGLVCSYDLGLYTWVKLTDRWWASGSDAWQGRHRAATTSSSNRGVLANLESDVAASMPDESGTETVQPAWWNVALTLGHLETRMHSTRLLESPVEYKQALLLYAKKIADEGFRAKAEDLIKELFGPIYWRPGRDDVWSPTVIGLQKRDLLREVLNIFSRSKTLPKLGADWQDTLRKATNEEW
ncbi:histone transcription regulator 1 [Fistulina hepatica ATCC 64428]|uniref:Protein HIR n=1 Tax=Fistulina hepatica ATCC 64428 TaxID=1128425 RepID=A0A0D7A407_9AGAR|nr:histone transcription regulator 1 [Fistulina hepatica ATCC 64428]